MQCLGTHKALEPCAYANAQGTREALCFSELRAAIWKAGAERIDGRASGPLRV